MHPEQIRFCLEVKDRFPHLFQNSKVLDIGSLDVNGNNRLLFDNCEYVGCDIGAGPNVDVVCPGHEYPAEPASLDVIISTEAFEHDPYLEKTLQHAMRLLRPGGLLLFTCATGSRKEHGTTSNKPTDSPYTNEHYQNVSFDMVKSIIDIDEFESHEIRVFNREDLYFYGIKKEDEPSYNNIEDWDWDKYLADYPDLAGAGILTDDDAYQHWLNYGIEEPNRRLYRRTYCCPSYHKNHFWDKGYIRLGKLFDESEIETLKEGVLADDQMRERYESAKEHIAQGGHPHNSTLHVMNEIDSIYAKACLNPKIINRVSEFFDDPAYLYHTKVPLKYPGMIGFSWHQDYYYWYDMGCPFPALATCFIALDPATKENGCLEIIPQSHKCGRLNHIFNDGTIADSECDSARVAVMQERFGLDFIELEPGEVVLFHSNVLHRSADNHSNKSRLAVLGCFNTKANSPLVELHKDGELNHPEYSPQPRTKGRIQ